MNKRLRAMAVSAVAGAVVFTAGGCGSDDDSGGSAAGEADGTGGASGGRQPAETGDGAAPRPGGGHELPGLPDPAEAAGLLAELTVAEPEPMTGYSRDRFPHWASVDGCTVRQLVLRRDGEGVEVDDECRPVAGSWFSAYDAREYGDDGEIDIDHMVPLANAWRSGADAWTDDERGEFANDLEHPQLIAVASGVNREKGDQSPDEWLPPAEDFHCTYAVAWTSVKHTYELTITEAELATLTDLLGTCEA
ncbi:HNH endonuclease family protein [Streptomyces marincola]|uniref:HNH endonuclease family protein n=1 Tax=Streptomyces marincola TaxID=2878388 RepID=UPI001CF14597|nr:HNH endonuclease family protein [Streptomyces marincola]UCM88578.1 HNH endonuclease family protein [Streptomyces marincola]